MLAWAGCTASPRVGAPPPDAELVRRVQGRLAALADIADDAIEVRAREGVVELAGTAPSAAAIRRILREVGQVDGVRAVVNRLRILSRHPSTGGSGAARSGGRFSPLRAP